MKRTAKRIKTLEWRKSERTDSMSLWINGEKANIYYFTPEYKYYRGTAEQERAENFCELIRSGVVKFCSDEESPDSCSRIPSVIEKRIEFVEITEENEKEFDWMSFSSVSGSPLGKYDFESALADVKGDRFCSFQWTHFIAPDYSRIDLRVGIKIYPHGYKLCPPSFKGGC